MDTERKIEKLEAAVKELTRRIGTLEDVHAIRRLQHLYGFFIDKCLYDETVDLFTENCEVRFMGGIFKGKKGARRLYCDRFRRNFTSGLNGPVYGFLLDHLQLQDVVDVAPDGRTAHARFRCFMQAGRHDGTGAGGEVPRQWWEGGLYENEYVKEDGVWKFNVLDYNPVWHALYEKGWSHTPPRFVPSFTKTYPDDPMGPDMLTTDEHRVLWPETSVVPFHCPHPVTGRPVVPQKPV